MNIELIPAIDIIGGQCVRLTKGDYDHKKVYDDNPSEVAKHFEKLGSNVCMWWILTEPNPSISSTTTC